MTDNLIQHGLEQDARRVKERILMGAKYEKAVKVASDLKEFLAEHNWAQAAVARKLAVSNSAISQFLQNKYKGDVDALANKIVHLINTVARKDRRVRNKPFIETSVAKRIHTLITQTEAFSEEDVEGKIGIIIGDGGHGKSHCLREYARVNPNSTYVELDDAMSPTMMFNEIAGKLNLYSAGSLAMTTRKLIDNLQNRQMIIMLDEASGLKVKQLNQLRQIIVGKCHCPLILAGNKGLLETVMQSTTRKGYESLDQFTSRLMSILDLDMAASGKDNGLYTVNDIRKLYEYGGIRLTTDAVRTLRKISKTSKSGRLRTCGHVIAALHTSGIVTDTGQIDSDLIIAAIEQLDLPVRTRLPLNIGEPDADEQEQKKAKTA